MNAAVVWSILAGFPGDPLSNPRTEEEQERERHFLEAALARARETLARRAAHLSQASPQFAAAVDAYLEEPIEAPAPAQASRFRNIAEAELRPLRVEVAAIALLIGALKAAQLREVLRLALVREHTTRNVVMELKKMGEDDPRFEDVNSRLDLLARLATEWAAELRGTAGESGLTL